MRNVATAQSIPFHLLGVMLVQIHEHASSMVVVSMPESLTLNNATVQTNRIVRTLHQAYVSLFFVASAIGYFFVNRGCYHYHYKSHEQPL